MESGWVRITAMGGLAIALGAAACGGSTTGGEGASSGNAGGGSGGVGGKGGMGAMGGKGGTGAMGGSGAMGGVAATGGGGTNPLCAEISAKYQQKLPLAKQCNPFIDVEQCTVLIAGELACGCATYVSSSQQITLSDLMDLKKEWEAQSCGANILCEPCPPQPTSGYCQPAGSVGTCTDVF